MSPVDVPGFYISEFCDQTLGEFRLFVQDNHGPLLKIVICSNGGDTDSVLAMIAIMDAARSCGKQFITVGIGRALSSGLILLCAGDFRYADRRCRLMMHQTACAASGPSEHLTIHADEIERLNHTVMVEMSARSKLTVKRLKKAMAQGDWYLTPDEALGFGLIDFVGLPTVSLALGVL